MHNHNTVLTIWFFVKAIVFLHGGFIKVAAVLFAIITTEIEPWKLEPIYQNIMDICIRLISHIFWHIINQIYTAQVRYILDLPINHDIGITFHIDTAGRRNTARRRRIICSTTTIFARRGIYNIIWRIRYWIFAA